MPADTTSGPLTGSERFGLAAHGDDAAISSAYASLYPDLKRVARARLSQQGRADHLGTTTLLHESFIRLVSTRNLRFEDRRHFFSYAARTMRSIIVDSARELLLERRGSGALHVELEEGSVLSVPDPSGGDDLIRIHDALVELEAVDPELAEVVTMRYFGGYSDLEIADILGTTDRTIRRRWSKARAWLYVSLNADPKHQPPADEAAP